MARIVHGLFIAGLPWSSNIHPTLFVDGPLSASSISGLSPLTTSTNIVQCMLPSGISGAAARLNLRDPLVSAAAPTAQLQDDKTGTLSALFGPDPGWANTTRWTLLHTTSVAKATTSIVLSGPTAPTVDQIIYLGNEAMQVSAVSSSHNTHTVTVTRGVCGTRALVHSLDPSSYPPGDDGSRESLVAYSRRVYDSSRKIECALYQFKMSDTNPHNISSVLWAWYGYLSDVPKCNTDFVWSISVNHFSKALSEHTIRGGEELETTYAAKVLIQSSHGSGYGSTVGESMLDKPQMVQFILTVYEFERLFNMPIHSAQLPTTTSAAISAADTAIKTATKVYYEILGEIGGYKYAWKVTQIASGFSVTGEYQTLLVKGVLQASEPGSSITNDPKVWPPYGDFTKHREDGLNDGFIRQSNGFSLSEYRIRVEQGETAPKLSLRVRISPACFADAALYLMLSDWGSQSNDATYDAIVGGRGLGFNPSWVNSGSTPADPSTVGLDTQAWLEHKAIDAERYEYYFEPKRNVGDWFRNELTLRNMIMAFVPSTGKISARIWARKEAAAGALNPAIWPVSDIETSEVLAEQRVIFLERGIDPITLDAKFRKPLQDFEARSTDYSNAPTVRIWRTGGAIQDAELQTGNLANFLRAQFGVGIGTPRVFAVPLSPDSGVSFGDLYTWTDPSIPTASGRGFSSKRVIVLGIDPYFSEFITYAWCIEDLLNIEATESSDTTSIQSTGQVVKGIIDLDASARTATIWTDGLDFTQAFDVTTGDSSVWSTAPYGIVKTRDAHNPVGTTEKRGLKELYFVVSSVSYDSGLDRSYINISWNAAQDTTRGLTASDIIKIGSFVQLPDYRPGFTAPDGGTYIQPHANQGYNGGSGSNISHINAVSRRPRFDGRRSLIGA